MAWGTAEPMPFEHPASKLLVAAYQIEQGSALFHAISGFYFRKLNSGAHVVCVSLHVDGTHATDLTQLIAYFRAVARVPLAQRSHNGKKNILFLTYPKDYELDLQFAAGQYEEIDETRYPLSSQLITYYP